MTAALNSFVASSLERRIHVIQGEHFVTADPQVVLTTTLGSCVAACLRDPVAGVGGMNHFLLPDGAGRIDAAATRYGAYAMELLINGLLSAGARRERLQAKLFGGGHLFDRLTDVGDQNVDFAEAFLMREDIPLIGGSVRGTHARRVQFWPISGRVRQMILARGEDKVFEAETRGKLPVEDAGSVELFD
jgi:chemotaxis protein CheD